MVVIAVARYARGMPWIALVGALTLGAPRFVLRTPMLEPEAGGLVCRVENESADARSVRVEALDAAGDATFDSGGFALAAGAVFLSGGGTAARSCRFTVEGKLEGVRLQGLVSSADGGAPRALLPEPASGRP
jgi:hypothetical protein